MGAAFLSAFLGCLPCSGVLALDLLPGLFEKEKVKATIWELNEQYVRLVQIEKGAPLNEHPAALDPIEVGEALASLQLWVKGGLLRDEQSSPVYPQKQAAMIARYVVEALSKASPDEDVTFNVRGYTDVLLSLAREREWTTGRVFFRDGKLNLIVGEYGKRLDKAKKTAEGSFGVVDDFRDVHFQVGTRGSKGKMTGRIVNTPGVELHDEGELRPDWALIEVAAAAAAFRDTQVPVAMRREEQKAKAEAAKLTLERRQMREEMARLRKELKALQAGGGGGGAASIESLEERLAKLQQLRDKGLIDDDDFERRKQAILEEI